LGVDGGGEEGEKKARPWADLGEARGEREGVDRDGRGEGCRGGVVDGKGGFGHLFLLPPPHVLGRPGAGQAGGGFQVGQGEAREAGSAWWGSTAERAREREGEGRLGLGLEARARVS